MIKGIRGAIDVERDEPPKIYEATTELLGQILKNNFLESGDIVAITFTATHDLKSAYPARAAREMGLSDVPLMCTQEMYVEGSLPRCIRVLVLINDKGQKLNHVYLGQAKSLRPDLK